MAAIIVAILACIPLFLNIEKEEIEDTSTIITPVPTTTTTFIEGSGEIESGEGSGFVETTESGIFPTKTTKPTTKTYTDWKTD